MGRMVANQGNGECVSMNDPTSGAPAANDAVVVPGSPPVQSLCINTAQLTAAVQVIPEVRVNGKPVVVKESEIPQSITAGVPPTATGVTSGMPVNGKCTFTSASDLVFVKGKPLIRHRDATRQDSGNCPGGVKLAEAFSLDGSGIVIDPAMSPAQREQILKQLDSLYERPRTRRLLDTIRADYQGRLAAGKAGNLITVSANTYLGAPCAPLAAGQISIGPAANDYNGVGNPSWVQFDPYQKLRLPGYSEVMPPHFALAHELVHAMHAGRGTTLAGTSTGTLPNGTPAAPMDNFELQSMGIGSESNSSLAESRFAEERGMAVRRSHGPSEGNYPFNPDKASKAAREFAKGAAGECFVYCNK